VLGSSKEKMTSSDGASKDARPSNFMKRNRVYGKSMGPPAHESSG